MNTSLGARATESNVGLLFDFRVERVESLRHIVVKCARLSIVLACDGNYSADFFRLEKSYTTVLGSIKLQTRSVSYSLSWGLLFVDPLLN